MSDGLKKVQAGQPLVIPASAYNAFVDAALDYQRRSTQFAQGARSSTHSPGVILLRNDALSDLPRFAVLGIDEPIIDPGDNEEAFKNRIALSGVTPAADTHQGRYAILAEPIQAGKIGRAIVDGVSIIKLTVDNDVDSLRFAEIVDGNTNHLKAQESGSAAILWRAGGTGTQWAVVRLLGVIPAAVGAYAFPVTLTQTGGAQGSLTSPASWRYKVSDMLSGEELLTSVDPTASPHHYKRPALGPMVAATFGYAHWQDDGNGAQELALGWINETLSPVSSSVVTAWRLDKISHKFQVKRRDIVTIAHGTESGWTDVPDADGGILDQGVAL